MDGEIPDWEGVSLSARGIRVHRGAWREPRGAESFSLEVPKWCPFHGDSGLSSHQVTVSSRILPLMCLSAAPSSAHSISASLNITDAGCLGPLWVWGANGCLCFLSATCRGGFRLQEAGLSVPCVLL